MIVGLLMMVYDFYLMILVVNQYFYYHLPAMHHLLKSGANPHLKNKRNVSPFELAQKMKKDFDTMQVFKKDYGWKHDAGLAHTEL